MVIVSGNLNLSKLSCTDSFYRSSVPNNQIEMRFFALYSRRRVHKPAYLDSFVKVIFRGDTCPQSYGLQNNARRQRNAILQFVARNNTSEDCRTFLCSLLPAKHWTEIGVHYCQYNVSFSCCSINNNNVDYIITSIRSVLLINAVVGLHCEYIAIPARPKGRTNGRYGRKEYVNNISSKHKSIYTFNWYNL